MSDTIKSELFNKIYGEITFEGWLDGKYELSEPTMWDFRDIVDPSRWSISVPYPDDETALELQRIRKRQLEAYTYFIEKTSERRLEFVLSKVNKADYPEILLKSEINRIWASLESDETERLSNILAGERSHWIITGPTSRLILQGEDDDRFRLAHPVMDEIQNSVGQHKDGGLIWTWSTFKVWVGLKNHQIPGSVTSDAITKPCAGDYMDDNYWKRAYEINNNSNSWTDVHKIISKEMLQVGFYKPRHTSYESFKSGKQSFDKKRMSVKSK